MPECESVEDSGRTRRKAVFKAALPKTGDNTDVDDSGDEMSDDDEIDMSRVVPLDQVRVHVVFRINLRLSCTSTSTMEY